MNWDLSTASGWRLYCGLLVALFLARGIWLLCVIPPLEQWDEYQHVAYMQHLTLQAEAPVLFSADAVVSEQLLREAARLPQPIKMLEQTYGSGARGYSAYWEGLEDEPAPARVQPRIPLYEAQHGAFYYQLATPIFRALGGVTELRSVIAALRVCNLLLVAVALGMAVHTFGLLFADRRYAALAGLLTATQPLFLLNALRVSNDALGIAGTTVVIVWAVRSDRHGSLGWAIAAGAAGGVAILAKGFGLLVVPLVVFSICLSIALGQVSKPRGALVLCVALIVTAAVSAPQMLFSWEHYGSPTAMIEAVRNRNAGRGLVDLLASALEIRWPWNLANLWLRGSSWVGGWSFLQADSTLRTAVAVTLSLMSFGWVLGWWPGNRAAGSPFRVAGTSLRLGALVVLMTLALAYHMLHTQLATGVIMTNAWYAALAFPWALALACAGSRYWPVDFVRFGLPWLLVGLYVAIEVSGTVLEMIPTYTGGSSGLPALERLAALQPAALGTATLLVSAALAMGLLGVAVFRCASDMKGPPFLAHPPRASPPATDPGAKCRQTTQPHESLLSSSSITRSNDS